MNHQYFGYSSSGQPSCIDSCSEDNIYQTNYCCESLSNSCQIKTFAPTTCNSAYFQDQACQACPNFCSTSLNVCVGVGSANDQCQRNCSLGTVFSSDVGQCLSCDAACDECTQPFDSQYCSKCKDGYVYLQGKCNRCAPECLTCSLTVNSCLSCPINSSRPLFVNGRCIPYCGSGKYF